MIKRIYMLVHFNTYFCESIMKFVMLNSNINTQIIEFHVIRKRMPFKKSPLGNKITDVLTWTTRIRSFQARNSFRRGHAIQISINRVQSDGNRIRSIWFFQTKITKFCKQKFNFEHSTGNFMKAEAFQLMTTKITTKSGINFETISCITDFRIMLKYVKYWNSNNWILAWFRLWIISMKDATWKIVRLTECIFAQWTPYGKLPTNDQT